MIDRIIFNNVVPQAFIVDGSFSGHSDVWGENIMFEKESNYLIEAASGTGKTTLCSYIMGTRNDYRGEILFDNIDIRKLNVKQWSQVRQTGIGWLSQELDLFPDLTVNDNIRIKNSLTSYRTQNYIANLLERLGIIEKRDVHVKLLSLGQRQRVAFIRMLCQPADFFILDEPVSHLDNANNILLSAILVEVLKETGAGAIITSVGNRLELPGLKVFTL